MLKDRCFCIVVLMSFCGFYWFIFSCVAICAKCHRRKITKQVNTEFSIVSIICHTLLLSTNLTSLNQMIKSAVFVFFFFFLYQSIPFTISIYGNLNSNDPCDCCWNELFLFPLLFDITFNCAICFSFSFFLFSFAERVTRPNVNTREKKRIHKNV